MEDLRPLDATLLVRCDRRALLAGLGITAASAALALGTAEVARAQDTTPPKKPPVETKRAAPPTRRGISPPAASSAPSGRGPTAPDGESDSVPGGLPGNWGEPKTGPGPGGLPGNR